ncbi:DNA replication ATP-dependent helicase/nuclease DNA2 [Canna indica]|uniref:DNA helicase n=1 Tax=Canna indica TaxID=4628 RepID=A0AAQ3KCS0_9LILI|nr:DNA replication ATP-dependent helicase/nuclease DNA2 [Canna indica]
MPPKRRNAASSSAAARKSNQGQQPSQPSKFGIQHFFERHSQSQTAAPSESSKRSTTIADRNPSLPPVDDQPAPKLDAAPANDGKVSSQDSPEVTKSVANKRFKFSPGMLLSQSQDDGGVVTWKISPVNERLRAISSNKLPGVTSILKQRPQGSTFRPCSLKQDPSCSSGKFQNWLSSPTAVASKKSLDLSGKILVEESEISDSYGTNGNVKDASIVDLKSEFQTPPSMPYGPKEVISLISVSLYMISDFFPWRYLFALLELLDQVEDAITDESVAGNPNNSTTHDTKEAKVELESNPSIGNSGVNPGKDLDSLHYDTFLVLEVSEKHKNASLCSEGPLKVLRLLNEQSGQERVVHLCDEWFYSSIEPGDTINVDGDFDDMGRCIVDHAKNLVIVHPGILLSGTRVASSFSCPRRAVLDERLKSSEHSSAALLGTLLHQIFQAGLLHDFPSRQLLEEYAGIIIQKNMESLYACGANEKDIFSKLIDAVPRILNWLTCFKDKEEGKSVSVDFGHSDGLKDVSVTEVIDIEEMARAPKYGLKGMIDASLRVRMTSSNNGSYETIMPLEFKTGKGNSGQIAIEHCAQVILYTLLMSERYLKKGIDSGLLYYLQMDQTQGVKVERSDLVGLIMRRNELAMDILKASRTQYLPPMLQNVSMCKVCRHLNVCTVYHKAYGGNSDSSGLGVLFDNLVGHLTFAHFNFLKHWVRLVDLEAQASQVNKRERLLSYNSKRDNNTGSLSYALLDVKYEKDEGSFTNKKYIYNFVRSGKISQVKNDSSEPGMSDLDYTLRCGDYVVLSTESGRAAVASGVVDDVNQSCISVSFSRHLRLPGCSSDIGRLIQEVWRIEKDEFTTSFSIMRFNLVQLFTQSSQCGQLRKMIVDLEAPRFDSGGILSQDPALSYVRSEKNLNDDQRRSIQKILAAKDYTLILGMPGTGKTSTMVHAVKALLMRGASILLTSYTNLAIDTLLIKLKYLGIDFVRIGRREAIHADVMDHCISAEDIQTVDDIKAKMEHARVVGVTCLGINHPLLVNKKFDICIMDEAGQTTLPVSLGPLMLASKFVLVGDHYQLPPLVQSAEARENGMSISLFCRLSEAHPQAISALQCQYRMCAGIMELSNALIYGNRLRCGSSEVANAKLKFFNSEPIHSWLQEVKSSVLNIKLNIAPSDKLPANEERTVKSVVNHVEAYIISEVTQKLVRRGIDGQDIGIITPYNSQANIIRQLLGPLVEVQTIDKYQGRDKDCILLSFVRSKSSGSCVSSLLGDWHRINVAVTRAKRLVDHNDATGHRPLKPHHQASAFNRAPKPPIKVRRYLEHIVRHAKCSPSCYVVAYIYLDRFLRRHPAVSLDSRNVHLFLLTSILAAAKFMGDAHCKINAYLGKIGGISTMEMNLLEIKFLFGIGFELSVTPLIFSSYSLILHQELYLESPLPPSISTSCLTEDSTSSMAPSSNRSRADRSAHTYISF